MAQKRSSRAAGPAPAAPNFTPVPVRYRHDGWTPERQVAFIRALAECGCVRDACRRVGLSPETAYALARRPDAQSFRVAWELAMDQAVRRIADEAFSRAIHGVAVPHYYEGELIGEHRRYDERLTMFILARRDPARWGAKREEEDAGGVHPEQPALAFGDALNWVEADARREAAGLPRTIVRRFPADGEEEPEEPLTLDDFRKLDRAGAERHPPDLSSGSSASETPEPSR